MNVKKNALLILVSLAATLLVGCGVSSAPIPFQDGQPTTDGNNGIANVPSSVINSPPSGSTYAVGDNVPVQSTSSDQTGITRVDLLANDVVVDSDTTPGSAPQLQYSIIQNWMPDEAGTFTVTVIAYREDGTPGVPASIVVTITANTEEDTDNAPTAEDATPTATATAQAGNNPTVTFTPSYTPTTEGGDTGGNPTATYTPSYTPTTPPAAQEAPTDANFNNPLNLALDSTGSVTDFVSYPGGDTQDRVRWDITGMNPNSSLSGGRARLILAVSCFGTGIENVTFFTGGQTFGCGQTIVDREVTYDSRTGQVTITAVAGDATYVQWVLTGTATRVN